MALSTQNSMVSSTNSNAIMTVQDQQYLEWIRGLLVALFAAKQSDADSQTAQQEAIRYMTETIRKTSDEQFAMFAARHLMEFKARIDGQSTDWEYLRGMIIYKEQRLFSCCAIPALDARNFCLLLKTLTPFVHSLPLVREALPYELVILKRIFEILTMVRDTDFCNCVLDFLLSYSNNRSPDVFKSIADEDLLKLIKALEQFRERFPHTAVSTSQIIGNLRAIGGARQQPIASASTFNNSSPALPAAAASSIGVGSAISNPTGLFPWQQPSSVSTKVETKFTDLSKSETKEASPSSKTTTKEAIFSTSPSGSSFVRKSVSYATLTPLGNDSLFRITLEEVLTRELPRGSGNATGTEDSQEVFLIGTRRYYIGPRGGIYYINSKGKKQYVNS